MPKGDDQIILAHGGGGELTSRLLEQHVLPPLANALLAPLDDAAILDPGGPICFTTDAFVVQPLEFPGGTIGDLAVCGTVNDLAVSGAEPLALSSALVLEEGLPMAVLDRVMESIAAAARCANVPVATGDTKVIERRGAGGMIITTAGVGRLRPVAAGLGMAGIEAGDVVLVTGGLAEHGLAIMSVREHLSFETELVSDVAPLVDLAGAMLGAGGVKFLRDPTRGGLAGVLADLAAGAGVSVEVREADVPLLPAARHTADMLGLDPLTVANEGKIVAVVAAESAQRVLAACRSHELGARAAIIGTCTAAEPPLVELLTRGGGRRIVQKPYGEELPRIC